MNSIFYTIFVFSRRNRVLSLALFFAFFGASLFYAARITLEENIMDVIPDDQRVSGINQVLEDFQLKNRLVMHVYFKDSATGNPGQLIAASHRFCDSLQQASAEYISGIRLEISDSNVMALYDYYYDHLPFYLEEEDYAAIAEQITPEGLNEAMQHNYKALISPMGMVTKRMMVKDPLGLVNLPLQKAEDLRVDNTIQLYQNHLLTKDRKHLIFFIKLAYPANATAENGAFIAEMDDQIKAMEAENPSISIEYFGPAAVSAANAGRIKQDIYLTVSFAVIGLILIISFFYKNISVFFIAVTPGMTGGVAGVALLSLIKGDVSVIALGMGSVLLGITIDYALHFITHFKHEKNLKFLFKDIANPLLMSSATTSCAFFSLLFIGSGTLTDLGIFAGTSVLVASLFTLLVLPHLVIRKEPGTASENKSARSQGKNRVEQWVEKVASYPFYKRKWSVGLCLAVTLVSLFTWKDYGFESDMLKLNYMPERLAGFERNLNAVSTYSANSVYLITNGADLWEALEAERAAKQKLQSLEDEGSIHGFVMVSAMIPPRSVQARKLGRWQAFWEKEDVDSLFNGFYNAARQVGFQPEAFSGFENMVKRDYPFLDKEAAGKLLKVFGEDLVMRHSDGSVAVIASISLPAENKKPVLKELESLESSIIFDRGYFVDKLVSLLQDNFSQLVNISSLVVFALILINYGRLELALIAFVPVSLSWLWILGMMGLFALKFNIVNIIVCTFIFGLGIDYSVFMMRGLGQGYALGLRNLQSYRKSIVLSTVTTLTGIGVLIFARHPALQSIAFLGILGILSVVFLAFTVQPALYYLLVGRRKKKGLIPFTLVSLFLSGFAFGFFLLGCILVGILRVIFKFPVLGEKRKKQLYHRVIMLFCRALLGVMANIKKQHRGKENFDFTKPAIIIANHHSFLDIILLLSFHPKVVMVTNDWVYRSPFFGKVVQYADFILSSEGIEKQEEKIKRLIHEGYSIIVFPEGGRSESFRIQRFHKGAFYLAETFQLDIQPVVLHGTSYVMPKKDGFYVKSGTVTIKILPAIRHGDRSFGTSYRERTKMISRYFRSEYQKLREALETPEYFKEAILKNYIYKGPVLEWYLRVKFSLENGYRAFHELIPRDAVVTDIGCGYGLVSLSLAISSEKREVTGIDYDSQKIAVAANCPAMPVNLHFVQADVTEHLFEAADVFIVSDVLHYLTEEAQRKVMDQLVGALNPGGKIIIREGDSSKKGRHRGTMLTEIFSTKTGFNKTEHPLNYISERTVREFAAKNNFDLEIMDDTKLTSNTMFVLQKGTKTIKNEYGKV